MHHAVVVANGNHVIQNCNSRGRAPQKGGILPDKFSRCIVVGVNFAACRCHINTAAIRHGTAHSVNSRTPQRTTVFGTDAKDTALESGSTHHVLVDQRSTNDVAQTFNFRDALGLSNDNVENRFALTVESKQASVGLTDQNTGR